MRSRAVVAAILWILAVALFSGAVAARCRLEWTPEEPVCGESVTFFVSDSSTSTAGGTLVLGDCFVVGGEVLISADGAVIANVELWASYVFETPGNYYVRVGGEDIWGDPVSVAGRYMTVRAASSPGASGAADRLAGRVAWNGIPVSYFTQWELSVSVRDVVADMWLDETMFAYEYDPLTSVYEITGLPASDLRITVIVEEPSPSRFGPLAGEFRGTIYLDLASMSASERLNTDLELRRVVHLLEPWDNAKAEPSVTSADRVYPDPVSYTHLTLPTN